MSYLYQVLTQRVDVWRAANYPCDEFPAIRGILEFATEDGVTSGCR
jgi:type III restriction enzyme